MRKYLIPIIAAAVLLAAAYGGWRIYAHWREGHLLTMAKQELAANDVRNAVLNLQELLRISPQNLEATRLMADEADALDMPSALVWRRRLADLAGDSLAEHVALAKTALRMRDLAAATNALIGVSKVSENTAAFQNMAGEVYAAENHIDEAMAHFRQAIALSPQDPAPRVSLAVLQLHGTNATAIREGRSSLTDLVSATTTDPAGKKQAMRELVLDGLNHKEFSSAVSWADRLVAGGSNTFNDELLRLEALRQGHDERFQASMTALETEAAQDPNKVQPLATWWEGKLSPASALTWLQSLPAPVRTNEQVAVIIAENGIMQQDWNVVMSSAGKGSWGALEFARHAFKARAMRGQGFTESSKGEWHQALELCRGKNDQLTLMRLASQWHWIEEAENLLQDLVNEYPDDTTAARGLEEILFANGETLPLLRLYDQEHSRFPDDPTIKANLALTALIANATEIRGAEMARDLYQTSPSDPVVAVAYALSLHVKKKSAEAVQVMAKLPEVELQKPATAGFYGIFLQAAGQTAQARKYLDLGSKATMLPEERRIFEKARNSL